MPGSTNWYKGYGDEYLRLEAVLWAAPRSQHVRLIRGIRQLGEELMEAQANAYGGGYEPANLTSVSRGWYGLPGNQPMWLWDCTLTPEQMHAVMLETRARMIELFIAHPHNRLEFWIQCGHARFRTLLTWPSAKPEDANAWQAPAPDSWTEPELIRCWVHVPFNSGYSANPSEAAVKAADERLQYVLAQVESGKSPADFMTEDDVRTIAYGRRSGKRIWKGTPLAVAMGGPPDGQPSVTFHEVVDEPLAWPLPSPPDERKTRIPKRKVSGIELSWPGAGDGKLFPDPPPYAGHTP